MLELLQNLDGTLLLAIQEIRLAFLDPIVAFYTHVGDAGMLWILGSLLLALYRPTRKVGITALLALLLGFLCTNVVLKHLVGRERPWLKLAELIPLVAEHDPNSFPSGHTCSAFAAGAVWARGLPKKWTRCVAAVLAVCMGLSRLYVGVHYPSDVLVGAVVGLLCAIVAERIVNLVAKRNQLN